MTEWRELHNGYRVSDAGTVMRGFRYLKPTPRNGYSRVCLSIGGKKRYTTVHQLVAFAFLGPCPPDRQVAHLNGDRSDNRLSNLAYKTKAENEADKVAHGTAITGERNHNARLTEADVAAIRARLDAGEMQKAIAEEYGLGRMTVSKIARRETWQHVAEGHAPPNSDPADNHSHRDNNASGKGIE